MKKQILWILMCVLTVSCALLCAQGLNRAVTVLSETSDYPRQHRIVIDAGHGGVDGGATSCTGILESELNLQIALRLNDLMHFLGYETVMIRTSDVSVYTEGRTIAAKKVSDLKKRVQIANETDNALVLSIHQNNFPDGRYHGGVVLYADTEGSKELAQLLQNTLVDTLNPGSKRQCKRADGIYLMEHIQCPGVLIECGFLSNVQEEARLRSPAYQKQLCCVIASSVSRFSQEDGEISLKNTSTNT